MSLQVWLPFTNNLTDSQGLQNAVVTNSNVTLNTDGKLGKCAYFNSSGAKLEIPNIITNTNPEFSIAFWVNISQILNSYACICSSRTVTSGKGVCIWILSNGIRLDDGEIWTPSYSTTLNSWMHVTVTWSSTKGKYIYVNGIQIGYKSTVSNRDGISSDMYIGNDMKTPDTYRLIGKLNDFRVYSHALSVKEIKELSKGLVAHYKLTGWLDGINPNMFKETPRSYAPTTYLAYQLNLTENLVAGQTYTLHFWNVNVSHSAKSEGDLGLSVYWGGGNVLLKKCVGTDYFTNGHADHLIFSFTPTSSQASHANASNSFLHIYNSPLFVSGTLNLTIGKWKLEKGSVATPYVKTTEEMGGEDTTVYDSSGYINNLSTVGAVTTVNGTRRYSSATHFTNGQYLIATENSNTGWLPTDSITVCLWINFSTWGNPISCTEGGGWNFENSNGIQFPIYVKGVGYVVAKSGTTSSSLANAWHMLTATFDKTTAKIYIDGVLKGSANASTPNIIQYAPARLCISAEAQGTTPASSVMVGDISDVRIYATALSSDDVLELYHTSASIDKSGNMYAYEFKEI